MKLGDRIIVTKNPPDPYTKLSEDGKTYQTVSQIAGLTGVVTGTLDFSGVFQVTLQNGVIILLSAEYVEKMNPQKNTKEDLINHPKHYTSHPSGVECIEITRHMNFNDGNTVKYLWRAGLKDAPTDKDSLIQSIKDHKKAFWYISDEIAELERKLAKQSSDGPSH